MAGAPRTRSRSNPDGLRLGSRIAVHVVLLRGINLGARNRLAMPAFREALAAAGFADVRTYVQSGNAVVSSGDSAADVTRTVERLLRHELGLDVPVVVRSRADLARVVKLNPLAEVATDPKRYQVTFCAEKPSAEIVRRLEAAVAEPEALAVSGREIYAWHPAGVARSKLWTLLGTRQLGVVATSRNWTTVEALHELARTRGG